MAKARQIPKLRTNIVQIQDRRDTQVGRILKSIQKPEDRGFAYHFTCTLFTRQGAFRP